MLQNENFSFYGINQVPIFFTLDLVWAPYLSQVEFIRFEYDVEKAAKAVEESPLPNDFAEMLRKGN